MTGDPELRSGNGAPGTGMMLVNGNQVDSVTIDQVSVPSGSMEDGPDLGRWHDYL